MSQLLVSRGGTQAGCFVVNFHRQGTGYFPCLVAKNCARNDAYLRSLVQFMQHKVPNR